MGPKDPGDLRGREIIDSRDVIARIENLREQKDLALDGDGWPENSEEEFRQLIQLEDEVGGSPEWPYGDILISEDQFKYYARQLAEDIGALENCDKWPATCIDWDRAAEELKQDYRPIEFADVQYWIRS